MIKIPTQNKEPKGNKGIFESLMALIKKMGWKLAVIIGTTLGIPVAFVFIIPIILIIIIISFVFSFSLMFSIPTEDVTGKLDTELGNIDMNNHEEIEKYLENDNCSMSFSESASWAFSDFFGVDFIPSSACGTKTLLNKILKTKLNEMKTYGTKTEDDLPPGLLLSTIMYGYTTDLKEENMDVANPLEIVKDMLKTGKISPNDLKELVDNMVSKTLYPMYTWNEEVVETTSKEKDKDGKTTEKVVKITHKLSCKQNDVKDMQFDYKKYYTYLRYGKDVVGNVDGTVSDKITGKGYEYKNNLSMAWDSSDSKCKTGVYDITPPSKQGDIDIVYEYNTESISTAKNFFESRNVNDKTSIIDTTEFSKRADPTTTEKDDVIITVEGIKYNYSNGAVYNIFPKFLKSSTYKWDDIYSPKNIESIIYTIDTHENDMNSMLGYVTKDNSNTIDGIPNIGLDGIVFPLAKNIYVLTSCKGPRWGKMHNGIDIAAKAGTPVYSVLPGEVIQSIKAGERGNYVTVKHTVKNDNGSIEYLYTRYQHMTKRDVSIGDIIEAGDQVGTVGMTGVDKNGNIVSTGNHLHFEVLHGVTDSLSAAKIIDPYYRFLIEPFSKNDKDTTCHSQKYIGGVD